MHVLRRVIVKEFLQIRRDRRMIPIIFVAPVVQILVFGFAVNTDVTDVPTVLVDQDRTAASRDLVSASSTPATSRSWAPRSAPRRWTAGSSPRRAQLALVVGRASARRSPPGARRVQLLVDGTDATTANVALGYASALARELGAEVRKAPARRPPSPSRAPARPCSSRASSTTRT